MRNSTLPGLRAWNRLRSMFRLAPLPLFLLFLSGCASTSQTQTDVIVNRPALSSDGRLVAMQVWSRENPRVKLGLFDVETGSMSTVEGPPDQAWLNPSFSPSGDRIVFVRSCRARCTSGPTGFQIGILDLESGRDRTVIATRNLVRDAPIFAPGGRFVVYATKRIDDDLLRQTYWPKSFYYPRVGLKAGFVHMIDLQDGSETRVYPAEGAWTTFVYTRAVGFMNDKTLVVRSLAIALPDDQMTKQFQQREKRVRFSHGPDEKGDSHLYTIEFDKSFSLVGETPRPVKFSLLATDWVRPIVNPFHGGGRAVSYETGQVAFADRSLRNQRPFFGRGPREYDIFLGDMNSVRQVTFLFMERLHSPSISRSGNRIAFLADEDDKREAWGLWLHDVATGRTWFTDVKTLLVSAIRDSADTDATSGVVAYER